MMVRPDRRRKLTCAVAALVAIRKVFTSVNLVNATKRLSSSTTVGFHMGEPGERSHRTAPLIDDYIDARELRGQLRTYLKDHYLGFHITIVSVVLAMAGITAASLITHPAHSGTSLVLPWLLWADSLLATTVAYAGAMVGAFAAPASIPTVSDLLLPVLMCVTEFLLFAILISQVTSPAHLGTILATWLVLMSIFCLIALLSIRRAEHHYKIAIDNNIYSDTARPAVDQYIQYLDWDSFGAGTTGTVNAIGAALHLAGLTSTWLTFTFPAATAILLLLALRGHTDTALMWRHQLSADIDRIPHQAATPPTADQPVTHPNPTSRNDIQ